MACLSGQPYFNYQVPLDSLHLQISVYALLLTIQAQEEDPWQYSHCREEGLTSREAQVTQRAIVGPQLSL